MQLATSANRSATVNCLLLITLRMLCYQKKTVLLRLPCAKYYQSLQMRVTKAAVFQDGLWSDDGEKEVA